MGTSEQFNLYKARAQYCAEFERKCIKNSFTDLKTIDFDNKFDILTKGMDPKSIDTIKKVFDRMLICIDSDLETGVDYSLYSEEEKKIFEKLDSEFYFKINKISEELASWNKYFLPNDRFTANTFYYKHGIDEVENLNKVKERDIIDAGAYIGDSAIVLSDYTNKNVYSFEAFEENYALLQKTIELNKSKNIIPVNCALGQEKKDVYMTGSGSSAILLEELNPASTEDYKTIKMTTLDDYVKENSLDVGLIKVDIEGAEQKFLKGAYNTIKTQKPVLLLSIYHSVDDLLNIKPLIENWNLGYKFKVYKHVEYNILCETLLIAEVVD